VIKWIKRSQNTIPFLEHVAAAWKRLQNNTKNELKPVKRKVSSIIGCLYPKGEFGLTTGST
jgi:hypothetical protein